MLFSVFVHIWIEGEVLSLEEGDRRKGQFTLKFTPKPNNLPQIGAVLKEFGVSPQEAGQLVKFCQEILAERQR